MRGCIFCTSFSAWPRAERIRKATRARARRPDRGSSRAFRNARTCVHTFFDYVLWRGVPSFPSCEQISTFFSFPTLFFFSVLKCKTVSTMATYVQGAGQMPKQQFAPLQTSTSTYSLTMVVVIMLCTVIVTYLACRKLYKKFGDKIFSPFTSLGIDTTMITDLVKSLFPTSPPAEDYQP